MFFATILRIEKEFKSEYSFENLLVTYLYKQLFFNRKRIMNETSISYAKIFSWITVSQRRALKNRIKFIRMIHRNAPCLLLQAPPLIDLLHKTTADEINLTPLPTDSSASTKVSTASAQPQLFIKCTGPGPAKDGKQSESEDDVNE